MDLMERYALANPFVDISVGESEIWGEEGRDFCDIPAINAEAFFALKGDIEDVRRTHRSTVRFVVGTAGSGKSHLFARLRRHLGSEQFTFVPNPPRDPWTISRFILKKVVHGMQHPAMDGARQLPFSQMERFVYALLSKTPGFFCKGIEEIHALLQGIKRIRYGSLVEEFRNAL